MSEATDPVLKSLELIDKKLDLALRDFADLKRRIGELAAPTSSVELLLAAANGRLSLLDERLARIADRLDLIRRDLKADGALETCK